VIRESSITNDKNHDKRTRTIKASVLEEVCLQEASGIKIVICNLLWLDLFIVMIGFVQSIYMHANTLKEHYYGNIFIYQTVGLHDL